MGRPDVTGIIEQLKATIAEDIAFRKARREDFRAIAPALEHLAEAARTPEGTPFICCGTGGQERYPTYIYHDMRGPVCEVFKKENAPTCQAASTRGDCPYYRK